MSHPNVSPCADVILSVPALAADSFRAEVLDALKCAGENVVEGAEWFLERSDLNRLDHEDRPNLEAAQRLFDAIRDQRGDIMVTAPAEMLAGLVRSAMSQTASMLVDALDERRTIPNEMRAALAPLACWCDVIDAHDWLAEQYGDSDEVEDGGSQ